MNSKKRVLLIIPELIVGGAQRSISALSLEIARHHSVWLVIFNKNHQVAYLHGGELISLNVSAGNTLIGKIISLLKRIIRLKRIKRKFKIDVSISFLEGADYVNILSRSRDKVIVSIRGSKLHDETILNNFKWLRTKVLIPLLYRMANMVVTVNEGIAKEMYEHFKVPSSNILVINNFYDIARLERLSIESKSHLEQKYYDYPVMVTSGRLAVEKGFIALAEIYISLKRSVANLKWIIIGDGPEFNRLVNILKENKLLVSEKFGEGECSDVVMTGNQTNVYKYLYGSKLYLMNSSSEGFPNGLLEAMISKVPVIAADCPYGPREILLPGRAYKSQVDTKLVTKYGVLMPIAKTDDQKMMWVKTILELLSNPPLQTKLIDAASERARDFNTSKIMPQWLAII